jgi:hypothetical protein
MTTTRTTLILTFVGTLGMPACRDKLPCPDCGEDIDAEDDDDNDNPVPDLPCGGADLMTDNFNCGTCGHECGLYYEETKYEAGTCTAGVCGPLWTDCRPETIYENCSEMCIAFGKTCVPNGCAGLTGILFTVDFDSWGCNAYSYEPVVKMAGGCDEPIPWMSTDESLRDVQCCCDFQQPG